MNKSYYDILNVNKEATKEEIKKSYKALAKKYHPDISKEEHAKEKFQEIQEAYDILSNDKKRKKYDMFGINNNQNNNYYNNYNSYYSNTNAGFSNFKKINIKEWFSKKSLIQKILLIILFIFLSFIIVALAIIGLMFYLIRYLIKKIMR